MSTADQLRRGLRALADDVSTLIADEAIPLDERRAKLTEIETKDAELRKELADREYLDEQAKKYNLSALADANPTPYVTTTAATSAVNGDGTNVNVRTAQFGITTKGTVHASPPVTFTDEQCKMVHELAVSCRPGVIESKAVVSTDESPMSTIPTYQLPPVPFRREPLRVLDLLPKIAVESGEVDFFRITQPTDAASVVAEGATKPESTLEFEKVVTPIKKVAHWIRVNDEVLQDYSQFLNVLQDELLAGLILEENRQLLAGVGTGAHLLGMLNDTDILIRAKGSDSVLDALFKAHTDLRVGSSYVQADGLIMHPADFQDAVLGKASGSGEYLATNPITANPYMLWGTKVVVTSQIPEGTALVGSFAEAVQAYVRMSPRLEVNPWSETEFKANQTLVRAELRLGLGIVRPTALCEVTGL